jgi:hypothetical protein
MDPELATILNNIKSLAEQATQMGAVSGNSVEDELSPEMASKILKFMKDDGEKTEDMIDDDLLEAAKSIVAKKANKDAVMAKAQKAVDQTKNVETTSDEGSTATDGAEVRIEDQTEVNEDNIDEVAKTIAKALMMKKAVKKSKDPNMDGITKALNLIVDKLKVQEEFNANIIKGMGLGDDIIAKYNSEQIVQKSRPIVNDPNEVAKTLEVIKSLTGLNIQGATQEPVKADPHAISKSLTADNGKVLNMLWGK